MQILHLIPGGSLCAAPVTHGVTGEAGNHVGDMAEAQVRLPGVSRI